MRVLVQRVKEATCFTQTHSPVSIGAGLLLYVSFRSGDDVSLLPAMAKKVTHLRLFSDAHDKLNDSVLDRGFEILSISQFTLEGDLRKGHRPSFTNAMPAQEARRFFQVFNEELRRYGLTVKEGYFQEAMDIVSTNDGPVTLWLDSDSL